MIKHIVRQDPKEPKFVQIVSEISTLGSNRTLLQLPAWRPGRYELGNFAKNIKGFKVYDHSEKELNFKKISKDCWEIETNEVAYFYISYYYYAQQPDAGACYVSNEMIYLNPVHCFMYVSGRIEEGHQVKFEVPSDWKIACQLPINGMELSAPNFDALADSPVFVAAQMQHHSFSLNQTNFHFWFVGGEYPVLERLAADTQKYAAWQTNLFGELPCKDFHFMYLLLPTVFRHGVEHMDSTVIAMGPLAELGNEDVYHDFLAISSHELFHLWNVKRIRPVELLPYDFTKENYSRLGYVYEGVTTYYGDLALWLSGVWNWEQYSASLSGDLSKHLNNEGRNFYCVAESSFDTWLDGYVPGVPGRKVSIYTEGLVAALVADVMLIEATNGKKRLHDVMKVLYERTWNQGVGYTQEMYQSILEEIAGISFSSYFSELIEGKGHLENCLLESLFKLGLSAEKQVDVTGIVTYRIVKFMNPTISQAQLFDFWSQSH